MSSDLQVDRATLQSWLAAHRSVEILDIRRRMDYEDWQIPGARHLDVYDILHAGNPGSLADYQPSNNGPVILACYVGQTSQLAAEYLRGRGIEAYSLAGGMQEWSLAWNAASHSLNGLEVIQIQRIGKGCLSYLLIANRESLIIDASVEPEAYLQLADQNSVRIAGALDTHIHADHLSRGPWLAGRLAVPYYLPENRTATLPHHALKGGDRIEVGDVALDVLSTPGHTPESISLVFADEAVFTGDTLFIGSFGRPDLSGDPALARVNARALHSSLLSLRELPGSALVFPAHVDTPMAFGEPVVAASLDSVFGMFRFDADPDEFSARILANVPPPPANHLQIQKLNAAGRMPLEAASQIEAGANRCAVLQTIP